jgi:hypothetical protein
MNIGLVTSQDGLIFFEAPDSGIDNIWYLSENGPQQITSSLFGSYAPVLFKNELYYSEYTVEGMKIAKKSLNWNEVQSSHDSFYPIYEKFSKDEKIIDFEIELLKKESFKSNDYSQVKHALNLHSWIILAPPLSNTISLTGLSRDVLNKFFLTAGGEYNLNEQTLTGSVSATWSHLYPVFDLGAAYGGRRQKINQVEDHWEEGTFEAGLSIPWKFIQNRFIHQFTLRAFSKLIKVTNKISSDQSELNNETLFSRGVDLSYSFLQRLATRDMNAPLGFEMNIKTENGEDINGQNQKGSLESIDSRLFLPGVRYHHSF